MKHSLEITWREKFKIWKDFNAKMNDLISWNALENGTKYLTSLNSTKSTSKSDL